jgi:coenzyme F420 biosynthesis associated uncharacterized protein
LLIGALAGAFWVASRRYHGVPPRLIDWQRVRSAALRLAEFDGFEGDLTLVPSKADLTRQYGEMVRQSEDLIGSYVGIRLPERLSATYVFDQAEWIDANLANFELMFEPLEKINREALSEGTIGTYLLGSANQLAISGELGLLVGYLSRRVLGQYDLALLGREPLTNGRLYFVEPNIARLQERLSLDPREFRLWIALHEATHAFEFEGHPWLRDHMNGLLTRYFDSLSQDILGLRQRPGGIMNLLDRVSSNLFRSSYALELVMSGEQREIFRQIQALMCLVEGYSNHVMDQVGGTLLATYPTMKLRFEDRLRHKGLGDRVFAKLTGLEVKLEQYALGERFVGEVVRQRGIDYVNRAWTSPWHLPTMDEIRQPSLWIERVA